MDTRNSTAVILAAFVLAAVFSCVDVRAASVAKHLVGKAGISQGICSVVGCDDPALALEVVESSGFLVHVLTPTGQDAAAVHQAADKAGIGLGRLIAEKIPTGRLPYGDNVVDVVLVVDLSAARLGAVSAAEILRVLRPKGRAIIGYSNAATGASSRSDLTQWAKSAGLDAAKVANDALGVWVEITKPRPAGMDDWSHWQHRPDNNPVSDDTIIQSPYMTQWLSDPYYVAMPMTSVVADGRVFTATGHIAHHEREEPWLQTLLARNGYNGIELWRKKLPEDYLVHRSAFVATADTFYMIAMSGEGCAMLDPETGREKGCILFPEIAGQWKWIAIQGGKLFALIGRQPDPAEQHLVRGTQGHWGWMNLSPGYYRNPLPWGFGETLVAYDLKRRKVVWTHNEGAPIDSRAMILADGKAFFTVLGKRIACLDQAAGKLLWETRDSQTLNLITKDPGGSFRTTAYTLYAPRVLVYKVLSPQRFVAVSAEDGHFLWKRDKCGHAVDVIYLAEGDDAGLVTPSALVTTTPIIDVLTGKTRKEIPFAKYQCTRVTATPDSIFSRGTPRYFFTPDAVGGDGVKRYDRIKKKTIYNRAVRASCNDGAIGANGLLYIGPWCCDCNLSLMGAAAMCSAGNFDFQPDAPAAQRLEKGTGDSTRVVPLDVSPLDWPTYRANTARSAASRAPIAARPLPIWTFKPPLPVGATAASAAAGHVFLAGNDGKVRALDAATGQLQWSYQTAGPILQSPTICSGRAYVGSGDGYLYALEAATGRLLWRFRAAPVERRIMVYGRLCSTWPVNSGVLVHDGTAYAAAGIIDYDGTYVYALDAVTGALKWENTTTGHLEPEARKGVSAQGNLTIAQGKLWMAGGNLLSPVAFDLETGKCLTELPPLLARGANRGQEVGVLDDNHLVFGGRLRFSATRNVVNPGEFLIADISTTTATQEPLLWCKGQIPPAWDTKPAQGAPRAVAVQYIEEKPKRYSFEVLLAPRAQPAPGQRPPTLASMWTMQAPNMRDTVSLALASNAVVGVHSFPDLLSDNHRWSVCAADPAGGKIVWRGGLPSVPLPGGLLIDRDGRILVILEDGSVIAFGAKKQVAKNGVNGALAVQ